MSGILIPVSLFTKVFSYGLPGTIAGLPFIVFFILVLFQASQRTDTLVKPHIPTATLFYVLLIFVLQFWAIGRSYEIFGDSIQGIGVSTSFVDIIGLVVTVIIAYYAVKLTVVTEANIVTFIRSTIITLIVFEILVLIPQIIASVSPHMHAWVNLLGSLFEKRWHGRNFYDNGSYSTTMGRINGFEAEAGYLAGQIGLVFVPILVSGVANHFSFWKNGKETKRQYVGGVFLLVLTLAILFFAKTTTGFVVIGLSAVMLFWKANGRDKKILLLLCLVGLVSLAIAYIFVSPLRHLLNQYLFQKSGTENRAGGTIALLKTFVDHPFIGVGNGWAGPYLVNNAPAWSKNNWEYIYVYSVSGYPVLSVWGGWLAQYGLLLVAIPLVYLGRQVKSIISFKKELKLNNVQNNRSIALYVFLTDAFEIFLVMFFALAFLVFSWSEYYILVSLFFYIVGIKLLQKTIKKEML
ncbi:hypothetical protein LROSL1_0909 [Furfurilactobacillus rossiae]|uniref:hypothetical protein n=1 Tax=Furfurilactobacillus rossiae TaxID=231049 RepID=UPI0015BB8A4A|nr:hypothetical protein [Furfurilactobacillus rossiae]MCF6165368.1 hypothetical protein [Furfurilactobacillus rossiae]QLE63728.1 hypothetical protein LROSL1_0909 [Furfurilactobacillus rossiae]